MLAANTGSVWAHLEVVGRLTSVIGFSLMGLLVFAGCVLVAQIARTTDGCRLCGQVWQSIKESSCSPGSWTTPVYFHVLTSLSLMTCTLTCLTIFFVLYWWVVKVGDILHISFVLVNPTKWSRPVENWPGISVLHFHCFGVCQKPQHSVTARNNWSLFCIYLFIHFIKVHI